MTHVALVSMGSYECKKERKQRGKKPIEMRVQVTAAQTSPFHPSSPFYRCKYSPIIPYTDKIQLCVSVAINEDLCSPLEARHSGSSIAPIILDQHPLLWFIYGI